MTKLRDSTGALSVASVSRDDDETKECAVVACVLLTGGLRSSPLVTAARRSVLDLFLTPERTVLGVWLDHLKKLNHGSAVPCRVVHGGDGPMPFGAAIEEGAAVTFEKERGQYRGPAGAVRDACGMYGDEDVVLVADGARWVSASLDGLVADHCSHGADVTVAANPDGSPTGAYLLSRRVIDLTPSKGFMDLKEQLLEKALQSGMKIRVHRLDGGSKPVRTRKQFLGVCAEIVQREEKRPETGAGSARLEGASWRAADGELGAGCVLVDSVVMAGAVVGEGAVVARTIVCPGARVQPGGRVVDAVVSAEGVRSGDERPVVGRWKVRS